MHLSSKDYSRLHNDLKPVTSQSRHMKELVFALEQIVYREL